MSGIELGNSREIKLGSKQTGNNQTTSVTRQRAQTNISSDVNKQLSSHGCATAPQTKADAEMLSQILTNVREDVNSKATKYIAVAFAVAIVGMICFGGLSIGGIHDIGATAGVSAGAGSVTLTSGGVGLFYLYKVNKINKDSNFLLAEYGIRQLEMTVVPKVYRFAIEKLRQEEKLGNLPVPSKVLIRALAIGLWLKNNKLISETKGFAISTGTQGAKLLALLSENGQLRLIHADFEDPKLTLGMGTSGTVHRVCNVAEGIFEAFKKSALLAKIKKYQKEDRLKLTKLRKEFSECRDKARKEAISKEIEELNEIIKKTLEEEKRIKADLSTETAIMRKMNPKEDAKGLLRPASVVILDVEGLEDYTGFSTELVTKGDLSNFLMDPDLTPQDRFDCVSQLIHAFKVDCMDQNWIPNDFKPANILVHQDSATKEYQYKFADVERYRRADDPLPKDRPYPRVGECTYTYTTAADRRALLQSSAVGRENPGEFGEALKKQAIYSLGVILYKVLSGRLSAPYEIRRPDPDPRFNDPNVMYNSPFPDSRFHSQPLRTQGYSEELIQLIKDMTNLDPDKRPTIQQVSDRWSALVKSGQFFSG